MKIIVKENIKKDDEIIEAFVDMIYRKGWYEVDEDEGEVFVSMDCDWIREELESYLYDKGALEESGVEEAYREYWSKGL